MLSSMTDTTSDEDMEGHVEYTVNGMKKTKYNGGE